MRKFDLSLRSSRSSYFATFRHQLTILSKTDALDEEKWLNIDRKSGSAGMPRPISYAVFCLKKKTQRLKIAACHDNRWHRRRPTCASCDHDLPHSPVPPPR